MLAPRVHGCPRTRVALERHAARRAGAIDALPSVGGRARRDEGQQDGTGTEGLLSTQSKQSSQQTGGGGLYRYRYGGPAGYVSIERRRGIASPRRESMSIGTREQRRLQAVLRLPCTFCC